MDEDTEIIRLLKKTWSTDEYANYLLEAPPSKSVLFEVIPDVRALKEMLVNQEFEVCGNIGSNWLFCRKGTRTRSFSTYDSMLTFHTHCKEDSFFSLVDWFSFARSSAKSSILFSKSAIAIYTKRGKNIDRLSELYSENEHEYEHLPNMKYMALGKALLKFVKLDNLDESPLSLALLLDVDLEVFH